MNRRNALGLFGLLPFTSLLKADDTPKKELPNIEIGDRIRSKYDPKYIGRVYQIADTHFIEFTKNLLKSKPFPYLEKYSRWEEDPAYYVKLDVKIRHKNGDIVNTIALTRPDCRIIEKGNENEV